MEQTELEKKLAEALAFQNAEEVEAFKADVLHMRLMQEVKAEMERMEINRKELADLLGVSKGYVSQLFSGDTLLNLKTLAKLESIFQGKFVGRFVGNGMSYYDLTLNTGFSQVAESGAEYNSSAPEGEHLSE